jgi:lysophospholipase L1-like esterase
MSYEQQTFLHKFLHPEKVYPSLDEATVAGIMGTPLDRYRQIKAELQAEIQRAAEELLADSDFAARIDRLPFSSGATIVGLGDSITDDWQSWIELLRCLVESRRPQDNIRFVNAGFSGDTTTHLIWRFSPVVAEQPEWILCMIGTNDATRHGQNPLDVVISPQETEKNLKLLRHYAAMQTSAKWAWITPYGVIPEKMSSHWFVSTLPLVLRNEDIDKVVEAIRRQPDPIIDLPQMLGLPVNPDYLLGDGLHPSLEGHKAIVRALVNVLT